MPKLRVSFKYILKINFKKFTANSIYIILGLVRNAASFSLARNIDLNDVKAVDEKSLLVEWRDFERAVSECEPAFGNKDNDIISSHYRNYGFCNYGISFDHVWSTLNKLLSQTRNSSKTPLMTVLLEGAVSTGKTAIAARLCIESDFPFVRMISGDSYIGMSEAQKCAALLKVFSDSYKSPLSLIFIDDIERILDYTPIGPRFSNTVLQTLLILLRKLPPESCRLMIIATTSISDFLQDLQVVSAFQISLHINQLMLPEEIESVLVHYSTLDPNEMKIISNKIAHPIGLKQLLLVLEMVRSDSDSFSADDFISCLSTVGF